MIACRCQASRCQSALSSECQLQEVHYIMFATLHAGCTSTFGLPDSWMSRKQDAVDGIRTCMAAQQQQVGSKTLSGVSAAGIGRVASSTAALHTRVFTQ